MSLVRAVATRVRRAARADGAGESGLSALIGLHALHAAGDAMVAVALAGTLFFSVPIGEARGRVALYLLLTLLPFAFLVPIAGPLLDRFRHGRRNVLALTTGGRGLLTWVMAGAVSGLGLYPLALGVLVLSRAYGVARAAAIPRVRPPDLGLVSGAARVNVAGAVGTTVAGAVAAVVSIAFGPAQVLYLASVVLIVASVLALRLPDCVDERPDPNRVPDAHPRLLDLPRVLRAPLSATCGMRATQGLLTLFLAFLLRQQSASAAEVGFVLGGALIGGLIGTITAARMPGLAPRRLPFFAPGLALVACLVAALSPTTPMLAVAAGVSGLAGSMAKFGLDATIQTSISSDRVSTYFARSETALQLSWVLGAAIALLLPAQGALGFWAAVVLLGAGLLLAVRVSRQPAGPPPGARAAA
ncbi:MAG: MFS transporter [Mycobacteriales bacterium]